MDWHSGSTMQMLGLWWAVIASALAVAPTNDADATANAMAAADMPFIVDIRSSPSSLCAGGFPAGQKYGGFVTGLFLRFFVR